MVLREQAPHVIPRSCGGKMSCIFLMFIPMLGAMALAGLWMFRTKQTWELVDIRNTMVRQRALRIGQVIKDLNMERELTVLYVTARSEGSQIGLKGELDSARRHVDEAMINLDPAWPGDIKEGQMFKSRHLFHAVLQTHRSDVKVGNYFWDELQFYTNVLDVIFGWLHRHLKLYGEDTELWKWLLSYSYLMGSINYVGADQALCSVFNAIICFSHRETFYYANFSFSGEAVFKLYRQSFPIDRSNSWRTNVHQSFFPSLFTCREDIFSDMDYLGMSIDPSLCDYARKNETRYREVELLTVTESGVIADAIENLMVADSSKATFDFIFSGIILGSIVSYVTVLHIIRCTCVKCVQARTSRTWRMKELEAEEDRLEDKVDNYALQQTTNMIRYEDYNCTMKPNAIKVATV